MATRPTVLIAGAATPVGAGVARALAKHGATLILTDVNAGHLAEVAAELASGGGQVVSRMLDVTDPQSCEEVVRGTEERFGAVDVLVNAAEFDPERDAAGLTPADWELGARINLHGVVNLVSAVLPGMRSRSAGLIATVVTRPAARRGHILLASTRAGARAFSEGLRSEIADTGISVAILDCETGAMGEVANDVVRLVISQTDKNQTMV